MKLWAERFIAPGGDERVHRHVLHLMVHGELESLREEGLQHQLLASSSLCPPDHVSRRFGQDVVPVGVDPLRAARDPEWASGYGKRPVPPYATVPSTRSASFVA